MLTCLRPYTTVFCFVHSSFPRESLRLTGSSDEKQRKTHNFLSWHNFFVQRAVARRKKHGEHATHIQPEKPTKWSKAPLSAKSPPSPLSSSSPSHSLSPLLRPMSDALSGSTARRRTRQLSFFIGACEWLDLCNGPPLAFHASQASFPL